MLVCLKNKRTVTLKLHKAQSLSFSVSLSHSHLFFFPFDPHLFFCPSVPLLYRNWPISWACFSILLPCACIFYMHMFLRSSVCACSSSPVSDWLSANSLKCHNCLISREQAFWKVTSCARCSLSQIATFSAWCSNINKRVFRRCVNTLSIGSSAGTSQSLKKEFSNCGRLTKKELMPIYFTMDRHSVCCPRTRWKSHGFT